MSDNVMASDTIKEMVRARYGGIAASAETSCCAPAAATSCCDTAAPASDLNAKARDIGFDPPSVVTRRQFKLAQSDSQAVPILLGFAR